MFNISPLKRTTPYTNISTFNNSNVSLFNSISPNTSIVLNDSLQPLPIEQLDCLHVY